MNLMLNYTLCFCLPKYAQDYVGILWTSQSELETEVDS